MNNRYTTAAKWVGLLVLPLLYALPPVRVYIDGITGMLLSADFHNLRHFILSFGNWAPVISVLLMLLQALLAPLPSLVLILANAWIFGWFPGALYSWTGSLLGAALCFSLARWYGRPAVEKLFGTRKLNKVDMFFHQYGKYAVLIARLTPVLAFDLISYAAGLTAINMWTFLWATALGQTPAIVLYSLLGNNLSKGLMHILWAIPVILLLAILGIAAKQWYSRHTTT